MNDDEWPDLRVDDPQEHLRYFWALRGTYGRESAHVSDEDLRQFVKDGLSLCNPMEIREPKEVTRFLALSFLITPEQRASTLLNGVYRVAIENTDVSASRRVRFVFKHLVGRKPPSPEPDFGNWFVEIT